MAPLNILLARELTALLAPHPELMPRSSADVPAVITCPARDSARAARPDKSSLLALITDLTETVSPLNTNPIDMLSPVLTGSCTAAAAVSLMMSWLTSSTCWFVVAVASMCVCVCSRALLRCVGNLC